MPLRVVEAVEGGREQAQVAVDRSNASVRDGRPVPPGKGRELLVQRRGG